MSRIPLHRRRRWNLTDEVYRTSIIVFLGDEISLFGAPRTYGVNFTYTFQ